MGSNKRSVADIYNVQKDYARFDQRYNMTRQTLWNPEFADLRKAQRENLQRLLGEDAVGYTLPDSAFNRGATANLRNTHFEINRPNHLGNAWQPLGEPISRRRWVSNPSEASQFVVKVAGLYGADQVGLCKLDRRWVYSRYYDEDSKNSYPIVFSDEPGFEQYSEPTQLEDGTQVIPRQMRHAVVLLFEMDEEGISTAPTLTEMGTTNVSYSRISFTTVMLAEFLRGLGYHAIPSANCTALSIPLAIEAGLGQLGRHAKLINPKYGPRCRISKVITDLPLKSGEPIDFGVIEYCSTCKQCAEACPARAIPFGERNFPPMNECNSGGFLAWHLDHKKCYKYWSEVGTNCGICVAVCPYNTGSKHRSRTGRNPFWKKETPSSESAL